ncbi:phosphotransferase [Modestobacter sp. VKM Ac-2983]|uniref:phosphotransferase family protein n=1 Tax=Modestobacter sp. VKM Ac-2983 TaxID=3004137 RepID=UPI0022AB54BF|nr:phosphotransferase [Modestobacter sp. VKM Ac-2983]MCZ2804059.1 phosphotransferase [Modestobacter sp. VKM Ac-2983]
MTASVEQAVAAAVALARQHGLPVDDPALLSWGVNAVVHLRPAPVVARVAVYTPLLRPEIGRPFTREVALAAALTAAGAAVVAPSDLLPPGPHEHDGLTVSFWRHVDVSPDRPTAAQAGRSLAELHEVLGTLPPLWTGSPLDRPLQDLAVFVASGTGLGADPALLREVGELVTALRPRLAGPEMTLHGDTHPGNLLVTGEGLRWTDLEDTSRGPRHWDLASLRTSARLDGRAALDAMPDPVSDAELAPFVWLRKVYAGAWWFVHAAREPADLPEARARLAAAVEELHAGLARAT